MREIVTKFLEVFLFPIAVLCTIWLFYLDWDDALIGFLLGYVYWPLKLKGYDWDTFSLRHVHLIGVLTFLAYSASHYSGYLFVGGIQLAVGLFWGAPKETPNE